jgi:hypothetical protein
VLWLLSSSTVALYDASPETASAVGGDSAGLYFCTDATSRHVYLQDGDFATSDVTDRYASMFGYYSIGGALVVAHELVHRLADEIGFQTAKVANSMYYWVEGGADLISKEVVNVGMKRGKKSRF